MPPIPKRWLALCPQQKVALWERLLNELLFNEHLAGSDRKAALFEVAQFRRAIGDGTFAWLNSNQVSAVYNAYALVSEINNCAQGLVSVDHIRRRNELRDQIGNLLPKTREAFQAAIEALRRE